MANFVDFTRISPLYRIRSVSDLQNPTPLTHTQRAQRTEAPDRHQTADSAPAHTITMSLFYQSITVLCEGGF